MGELGSPESLPEMERPPLRKIDMYIRPDCPCCNMTKRYTVAFLASIGKIWFNKHVSIWNIQVIYEIAVVWRYEMKKKKKSARQLRYICISNDANKLDVHKEIKVFNRKGCWLTRCWVLRYQNNWRSKAGGVNTVSSRSLLTSYSFCCQPKWSRRHDYI